RKKAVSGHVDLRERPVSPQQIDMVQIWRNDDMPFAETALSYRSNGFFQGAARERHSLPSDPHVDRVGPTPSHYLPFRGDSSAIIRAFTSPAEDAGQEGPFYNSG